MEEEILKRLQAIEYNSLLAAKNMLTLEDVAAITGLCKSYLYKKKRKKEIPYYKPNGKLLYFDRTEVEAWMKQNRVNTKAEAEATAAAYLVGKGAL